MKSFHKIVDITFFMIIGLSILFIILNIIYFIVYNYQLIETLFECLLPILLLFLLAMVIKYFPKIFGKYCNIEEEQDRLEQLVIKLEYMLENKKLRVATFIIICSIIFITIMALLFAIYILVNKDGDNELLQQIIKFIENISSYIFMFS